MQIAGSNHGSRSVLYAATTVSPEVARVDDTAVIYSIDYRNNSILVPKHWLAYLAPELIREIAGDFRELSFSQQSDVFSFGYVANISFFSFLIN